MPRKHRGGHKSPPTRAGYRPTDRHFPSTKYIITLVNNPDFDNPDHLAKGVSVREARAVAKARKLLKDGNKDVMLFRWTKDGPRRISLRPRLLKPHTESDRPRKDDALAHTV